MRCVLGMAAEVDAAAPGGGEGAGGVRSRCGRGALHLAAANGRTHVCRFLLEGLGLPVDALSASGAPPSRPAAAARSSHVSSMLAERLISCFVFDAAAHAGETPLLLAATFGHTSTAAYLLDRGADPSTPDPNGGDTPLHWAAYNGAYDAAPASRRVAVHVRHALYHQASHCARVLANSTCSCRGSRAGEAAAAQGSRRGRGEPPRHGAACRRCTGARRRRQRLAEPRR